MRRPLISVLSLVLVVSAAWPQSRLEVVRADADSQRFAQVLEARPFAFPRDHGPHPEFRHEWWYFTGHLQAANGQRFGFELTFFRYALSPPGVEKVAASAWRTRSRGSTTAVSGSSRWGAWNASSGRYR